MTTNHRPLTPDEARHVLRNLDAGWSAETIHEADAIIAAQRRAVEPREIYPLEGFVPSEMHRPPFDVDFDRAIGRAPIRQRPGFLDSNASVHLAMALILAAGAAVLAQAIWG